MTKQIEFVVVSDEMTTLLGAGDLSGVPLPDDCAAFVISFGKSVSVEIHRDSQRVQWADLNPAVPRIGLVVRRDALRRLFEFTPSPRRGQRFFLATELAEMALAILECDRPAGAASTYRLGKSIELLCDLVEALKGEALLRAAPGDTLVQSDGQRLAVARRMIDEQWAEKLTLAKIASHCGLNRSKLAREFREVFRCTVTEAISAKRLEEARRQLLATDLPVGVIGYRSGYLNNASFTRAFSRRFGVSPSDLRVSRLAA